MIVVAKFGSSAIAAASSLRVSNVVGAESTKLASSNELNSWKRGFTPQAEIWNGRMAIAGLIIVLIILLASNLFFSG